MSTGASVSKAAKIVSVGDEVFAKAATVLVGADCHRRFGSAASTTWLKGKVQSAEIRQSAKGKRMRWYKVLFDCGGDVFKEKEVSHLSVKKTLPPDAVVASSNVDVFKPTQAPPKDVPIAPPSSPVKATQLDSAFEAAVGGDPKEIEASSTLQAATSSAAAASEDEPNPTINCHGVEWTRDDVFAQTDVNGAIPGKTWSCKDWFGNIHAADSDPYETFTHFDYFYAMFPQPMWKHMVNLTNQQLKASQK
jgi:hypothetical protein